MAAKKEDPTMTSDMPAEAFPEGTHPALPASEVTHAASKLQYRDAAEKPDPTTVAQEQVLHGDEASA